MELKGKKINFLGDSITQGVGSSCDANIYLNVLARNEELSAARNYGISGTRIARQFSDSVDQSYVNRYSQMDDDADIVVVFGGTNDFGHGDAPIGTFEDRCTDTYYGACHLLMEGLINKYPMGTIVFMTPIQRADGPDLNRVHPTKADVPLKAFADIIKEVAAYYAIPVLDLFSMSGIHPQIECNKVKYCPDGLHPNDAGNALIASRLAGFLKTL